MILLDTCVVSEAIKPQPDPAVMAWVETLDESQVFLPSLVLGELRKGVERLAPGRRKEALTLWLEQLSQRFVGRVLNFDAAAAHRWGVLAAQGEKTGKPLPVIDGQLAALAAVSGTVLATRNTVDFEGTGIGLFNPWGYSPEKRRTRIEDLPEHPGTLVGDPNTLHLEKPWDWSPEKG